MSVQRSVGSLHANRVNVVFVRLGTWVHVHDLLIFLYVILAARMMRLGIMRSDADGPCVCGINLMVINVFSVVKGLSVIRAY